MEWTLNHIPTLLTSAGAVIAAILGYTNGRQIQEIHLIMNSRLDKLLETVAAQSHLEGAATERARADLAESLKSGK
jgi:hypothetical protein